ncbi:dehydrogenase SagB, partial [Streptomyces sp. SID10244]|nr:dehydrogenase SagB [Streptomyces sp. SID10244]
SPGQIATLRTLNEGPLRPADDPDADTVDLLDRLVAAGVVSLTVTAGRRDLYSLRPFRRPPRPRPVPRSDAFELSRFTVVRRNGTDIVAEHPRSWCDVAVHDPETLATLVGLGS